MIQHKKIVNDKIGKNFKIILLSPKIQNNLASIQNFTKVFVINMTCLKYQKENIEKRITKKNPHIHTYIYNNVKAISLLASLLFSFITHKGMQTTIHCLNVQYL